MTDFEYPIQPVIPEDTKIERNLILTLIAKIMTVFGAMTAGQLSGEIKLSKAIINVLIDEMVKLQLIESRGLATADIKSDILYALTIKGTNFALEAMQQNQYIGPAPVALSDFVKQIQVQSIRHEEIHRAELTKSLEHLVLHDVIMLQLGPAANSARSVLLYGDPGNGKTSIAEALGKAFSDIIYLPYALVVANQIITFFDETIHEPVAIEPNNDREKPILDPRWVACKRPVVITGGELTLQMLDLSFNPQSKFYEAPVHLKALGGVFIIDDFGRQQVTPREILNRWIVPLEKGHDYLTTHTGRKFTVPFDQLVIFSTNMLPEQLSDAAALRRIYFKILVTSPSKEQYIEIFRRVCNQKEVPFSEDIVIGFFDDFYKAKKLVPSGSHPGFIVDHIIAACAYHGKQPAITRSLMELAWKNVAAENTQSLRH